jgi:hypothetical protein
MSKFSSNVRRVFYVLTRQQRVRKLEERLQRLEDRFAVTLSYYEHKIDTLINSVARTLPEQNNAPVSHTMEMNALEFDRRTDANEHRP